MKININLAEGMSENAWFYASLEAGEGGEDITLCRGKTAKDACNKAAALLRGLATKFEILKTASHPCRQDTQKAINKSKPRPITT